MALVAGGLSGADEAGTPTAEAQVLPVHMMPGNSIGETCETPHRRKQAF